MKKFSILFLSLSLSHSLPLSLSKLSTGNFYWYRVFHSFCAFFLATNSSLVTFEKLAIFNIVLSSRFIEILASKFRLTIQRFFFLARRKIEKFTRRKYVHTRHKKKEKILHDIKLIKIVMSYRTRRVKHTKTTEIKFD